MDVMAVITDAYWFRRPWYDALLLLYLATLFLLEAVIIKRKTSFGWVMSTKAGWLALVFSFSLFFVTPPPPQQLSPAAVGLRLVLAVLLTWELWELVRNRRGTP